MRASMAAAGVLASLPVRLLAAPGDLDPGFGGGIVTTEVAPGRDEGLVLVVQADGRIAGRGLHHGNDARPGRGRHEPGAALR